MATFDKDDYIPGDYWVISDCCGNKVRSSKTKMQWNKMRVCAIHWEAKPKLLNPPKVNLKEAQVVTNARPQGEYVFKDETLPIDPTVL